MAGKPSKKQKARARKQSAPAGPPAASGPELPAGGELAVQVSRFDLGAQEKVLSEALGPPPPGYHLTIVRGWIRSPGTVVAVWDINDAKALAQVEAAGWDRFRLRVLDADDRLLAEHGPARRSGTYHISLEARPQAIRLVIGIEREDGFFQTLARSGWVRMPPPPESRREGPAQLAALDPDLDRRALLAAEPPPRPGHAPGDNRLGPGARLAGRLGVAARAATGEEDRRRAQAALARASTPQPGRDGSPAGGAGEPASGGAGDEGAHRGSAASRHDLLDPGEPAPSSPRKWGPTSPAGPFSGPGSGG
ncbi:MAG: DUF4912 domain-containing protein [Acidobacteriota bacterium]|nr:DUF4912 domain-containing protein [Acidobacteriota bacterium]MDQ7087903.1 DUF4912 domain-containing protein [Acidobacteriota bacterium]